MEVGGNAGDAIVDKVKNMGAISFCFPELHDILQKLDKENKIFNEDGDIPLNCDLNRTY